MSDSARWARVNELFHAAVATPAAERATFLSAECSGDVALRAEVESLLAAHRDDDTGVRRGLVVGARLGDYEVTGFIAAGGMGEVYRARDTKLGRDVAIKVLPNAFGLDPDRLARFEREARLLATLNHPHIGAIYGLEDTAGIHALILELVEGPTLADRLSAGGPLPVQEAVTIARQIAEALEAAHEKGIIHRDLKPANIKLTLDGVVKVLDFGLAKVGVAEGAQSQAPTVTVGGTHEGVILGTVAYMSPEQARGQPVDKRTDIWAFGCVLYEMLTSRRAFVGEDISDTLANVLKIDPDWSALPSDTPPAIRTLLQSCLTKERRRRVAEISTALFVLEKGASLTPVAGTVSAVPLTGGLLWRRVAALTGVGVTVAAVATTLTWLATRPPLPRVVRTTITTPAWGALTLSGIDRDLAITPDGSRVVYRGNEQLLVRALDEIEPTVLAGLGAPRGVFISPDGQWVGFFDGAGPLKKVAISGGPPVTVSTVQGNSRGATWSEDGTIIFATSTLTTGLQRVSAAGGEPTVLTTPDNASGDHMWPESLPGGNAVLFTMTPADGNVDNAQIAVLDLRSGRSKVLIRGGSHAQYVGTGHLVYVVAGTLRAVAFDLARLEVVGDGTPAAVIEDVMTGRSGVADVAVAANGSLLYVRGGAGGQRTVTSVDRQGRASALEGLPLDAYRDVRVSPDGARLALATQGDVWTYDFVRATRSRLTSNPASDRSPLWTPDGKRIIFTSTRAGYPELFWRLADGTGNDERFLARDKTLGDLLASGWSPDGRQLLFTEVLPSLQCAIGQTAIQRLSDASVLVKSEFCNAHPAVAPNGRWIAYRSRGSGRDEIYVERYPELGDRQQISTDGGTIPLWSRDGRELFFSSLDYRQMFAVAVDAATRLVAGRPQVLFELGTPPSGPSRPYDLAPDGRFLVIRSGDAEADGGKASEIIVVLNWFEELKRLVPTN